MFRSIALAVPLAGFCLTLTANAGEVWRLGGFSTPESAVYDRQNARIIVSNIVGDATAADGNGTLSLVSIEGKMLDADWVTGLDAPKGSAIADGKLYVADLGNLRIVDLASGMMETVPVSGASFLNDVTATPDGAIFVTDTFANRIYRYGDGKAELFVEDDGLMNPNGILADGDRLIVASFGILSDKPEDMVPGGLVGIDLASSAVTPIEGSAGAGFLDGIVKLGDAFVVTDFFAGKVLSVTPGRVPQTVATLAMGSADIGSDGTDLFVPMMMEGELVRLTLD